MCIYQGILVEGNLRSRLVLLSELGIEISHKHDFYLKQTLFSSIVKSRLIFLHFAFINQSK